jgi:hypothetical protein
MGRKRATKKTEEIARTRSSQAPVSNHERIALLAYSYWEQRGNSGGSPEEDWFRAEREILGQPADSKQQQ